MRNHIGKKISSVLAGKKLGGMAECARRSFGQCLTAVRLLRCCTTSITTCRFARSERFNPADVESLMLGVALYSRSDSDDDVAQNSAHVREPSTKEPRDGAHVKWSCHKLTWEMCSLAEGLPFRVLVPYHLTLKTLRLRPEVVSC